MFNSMQPTILDTLFVQVTLPIVLTIIVAEWWIGKRIQSVGADFNRCPDEPTKPRHTP